MTEKDRLLELCTQEMTRRWGNVVPQECHERLTKEIQEIDNQNEAGYILDLVERKIRYPKNEHNLYVMDLLRIVSEDVDIKQPPAYEYGEFPDIDVDYLPVVRDYLKNEWAPKAFGSNYVCNIGTYGTFGIKNALINMARVHGKNRKEVLDLTTTLGLKDEDGKPLTWDKALEMYPALKKYCEENTDVAKAAKKLINRNNTMGKHAGGLIVSSVPLNNFIPLVKNKDGMPCSAWVEGLHGQDLGPMGLVKFDLLAITNLMQIAIACKLVKERHGVATINALPGQKDWSDDSYLEDKAAIALANKGDLKCIFQFDSDGIRAMAKAGGVDCFNDLVAYSALYRPGPMGMGMHDHFIKRKTGEEEYTIHPLLNPVLGKTYGVMVFQEQVMQLLNVVGCIPLKDCELIRKAISKKKEEYFRKYKEMFIINGQKRLGWAEEQIIDLWNQITAFAEYGFNRSHAVAYTVISSQLLWLKAHYPLEFFAAILSCENDSEKVQEYKIEAKRRKISVCPVDMNKSGVKFQIVGDCIYFGFANVKGIGEAVAERIVNNQTYADFKDFLMKFGTEAGVIKPLIGLSVFGDEDPIKLYKYYDWFRDQKKKREDRRKRYQKNCDKYLEELQHLCGPDATFDTVKGVEGDCEPQYAEDLTDLLKRHRRMINLFDKKISEEKPLGNEEDFKPEEIEVEEKVVTLYNSREECEKLFYGFMWQYPIERSPDFDGDKTFEDHRATAGKREDGQYLYVEGQVLSADRTEAKNKKTVYWLLKLQDAQGEVSFVQVWGDDWERWSEELQAGNLVAIQLMPPSGGFRRYTLYAPPKWQRDRLIPKEKRSDFRVLKRRKEGEA